MIQQDQPETRLLLGLDRNRDSALDQPVVRIEAEHSSWDELAAVLRSSERAGTGPSARALLAVATMWEEGAGSIERAFAELRAAFLAVVGLGIIDKGSRPRFERAYQEFKGLEHRLELVAEVGGVRYVNDTKATNDDSAAT